MIPGPKRAADPLGTNLPRAIVSLGGGPQQVPLLDAARAEGLRVVVVDRNADAPGMRSADHAVALSTHETRAVLAALRELETQVTIAGVVARTTGKALETAAAIAAEFGLPGLTEEVVRIATSKSDLREFCEQHDFAVPRGERLDAPGPTSLAPPVVVKPDYTVVGKRDVRRIDRHSDLADAIERAAASSFTCVVEVEEYVEGIDVACVFRCADGTADVLALYDEVLGFTKDGAVVPVAIATPSRLSGKARDAVERTVRDFAAPLDGVDNILILCLRVSLDGVARVIELHADLGGDRIADDLLPAAYPGFDYFRFVVRVAIGRSPMGVGERELPTVLFASGEELELVHPSSTSEMRLLLEDELRLRADVAIAPEGFSAEQRDRRPRAILLIGGGALQLPQFRHARALGLRVILTDSNENCAGCAQAHRFYRVSGSETEALVRIALAENQAFELVGAYCGADFGLPAVAAIHAALALGGVTPTDVGRALDKTAMLRTLRNAALALPKGRVARNFNELRSAAVALGFPVIVKPAGGSGSRGVETARDESELDAAWTGARTVSSTVVVEQLVRGRHIDVNGLFLPGGSFHGCGTMERFFSAPPLHVPTGGVQPSGLDRAIEERCYELVERGARALAIAAGPVKADVIVTADGPVLLEIGPRFQGDVITGHLTEYATGTLPIRAHFAALAGHPNPERFLRATRDRVTGWRALYPTQDGRLDRVEGLEEALQGTGVVHGFVSVARGARLRTPRDTTATVGFLWATGTSAAEVGRNLDAAAARVRFVPQVAGADGSPSAQHDRPAA